jgi:leucyl aminopeptidase
MKVEVRKSPLENLAADTLVVFVAQRPLSKNGGKKDEDKKVTKAGKKDEKPPASRAYIEGVTKAIQAKIQGAIDEGSLCATANETVFFRDAGLSGAKHLLTVGLGVAKEIDHENLRQAAASAVNALKSSKSKSLALAFDSLPHNSLAADVAVQAITEGAMLADYAFMDYKEKKDANNGVEQIILVSSAKTRAYEQGAEAGAVIAECVNFCRWLGDRPGNRMTPTMLADETEKAAKGTKLKVSVWDRARIKEEKMGSFLSVSLGSTQEPKFIAMEYNGAGASKRPVCFVGKGLTFDSGGISIKPSGGMEEMKYDMCGGAAVIATMLTIAKLKLKVNVIAYVPATENMPGPAANKPGDIVTARNGKTIEVNNTDAEGRLILADALVYASEQDPAMIIDAATLTGAMVVALGNTHTGFFTRNDKLAAKIQDAADASGEWVWRMPLTDFHARDMRGTYADLSNTSSSKGAGSATAAAFLENFVGKDIPWAHFDVAGTAWHIGDRLPYCPRKGASGAMVRTFLQLAMMQ